MTRIHGILATVLLTAFLVLGCSSNANNDAKSIIKNQANVTEDYVNGLVSAKNADDMVAAIENYTEGMKKLIPELKEFEKNYPEYKQGKMPEWMEADIKRLEAASAKIPEAMMKMVTYMMDGKVQAAMEKMGQEMSKLE
ncbi:hypothetical protein [Desulfobacula toluolica]|uniref:Lipoprotein n=1 Tax=Desulfobacula toluolica (strain DSM 7467 / Tol2) TaxID=651182 RepID=K0NCY8_DESTT|nr:hypothetical protein [Desulfobacula toluolica]CCK78575.1 uncharacterized protein TOL2_C04050 [Desulfobacula toluolica Tol2]